MSDPSFIQYNTQLFKKVAPFYDCFSFPVRKVREAFVRFLDLPSGANILDVATGTGDQAFSFAVAGNPVIGLDLSPDMLRIAHRRNHFSNTAFVLGDATMLPFNDHSFDATVLCFALHCMPAHLRIQTVQELKRVTRPKGKVAFLDYRLPDNRARRAMAYHVLSIYETDLWREFVLSRFEDVLTAQGLRIDQERHAFLGCLRMFSCAV